MRRSLLLRIDFTRDGGPLSLPPAARGAVEVRSVRVSAPLSGAIAAMKPDVLCFDYDCPDTQELNQLRETKREFPSVPILMLTQHNSEELAVWALRSRVWDYFVKPLDGEAFLQAVQQLRELRGGAQKHAPRDIIVPASTRTGHKNRRNAATPAANVAERAVAKAKAYIRSNFAEKVSAAEVARLCNMSPFHFSRSFKRICGVTFSDYLLEFRVKKAVQLIGQHRVTVTGACYEAGFRDVSYFSRIFKRYAGMTPSQYRDRCTNTKAQDNSDAGKTARHGGASAHDDSTADLHAELFVRRRRR